jgi:hypothetical protein
VAVPCKYGDKLRVLTPHSQSVSYFERYIFNVLCSEAGGPSGPPLALGP